MGFLSGGGGLEGRRYDVVKGEYSMRWYNALVKWILFVSAAFSFIASVQMMLHGKANAGKIPGYETCALVFGMVNVAYASFTIITRSALAKYERKAPYLLYALLIIPIFAHMAEAVWVTKLFKGTKMYSEATMQYQADVASTLVLQTVLLITNCIYFRKRKSKFIN